MIELFTAARTEQRNDSSNVEPEAVEGGKTTDTSMYDGAEASGVTLDDSPMSEDSGESPSSPASAVEHNVPSPSSDKESEKATTPELEDVIDITTMPRSESRVDSRSPSPATPEQCEPQEPATSDDMSDGSQPNPPLTEHIQVVDDMHVPESTTDSENVRIEVPFALWFC